MNRDIPFIRQGGDEPLPRDRFPCRACRQPVPMIHRRSYCYSCWDRIPAASKKALKAILHAPANRITQAASRRLYASIDAALNGSRCQQSSSAPLTPEA